MAFRKVPRINCVKMVRVIRGLGFTVHSGLARTTDREQVEAYLRDWIQWVLRHDIRFYWEAWQEAHEDYEDFLEKSKGLREKGKTA